MGQWCLHSPYFTAFLAQHCGNGHLNRKIKASSLKLVIVFSACFLHFELKMETSQMANVTICTQLIAKRATLTDMLAWITLMLTVSFIIFKL